MERRREYVKLERVGDRVYLDLLGSYPQELCIYPTKRQIRRLARFFASLGKGRRNKKFRTRLRSEELSFVFSIGAERRGAGEAPVLTFKYSYYNGRFESVSESYSRYICFGYGALRRFGGELSRFGETGKAQLSEN